MEQDDDRREEPEAQRVSRLPKVTQLSHDAARESPPAKPRFSLRPLYVVTAATLLVRTTQPYTERLKAQQEGALASTPTGKSGRRAG